MASAYLSSILIPLIGIIFPVCDMASFLIYVSGDFIT